MLTLTDLSFEAINKIRDYRWDGIIEKHEGPEDWNSTLDVYYPEFLSAAGFPVLLPVGRERNPNITILRSIISRDGDSMTLFLKDTTFYPDPEDELFCTGFMAVCDRVPGEEFFLAIVFHEWFVIDNMAAIMRQNARLHGEDATKYRFAALGTNIVCHHLSPAKRWVLSVFAP